MTAGLHRLVGLILWLAAVAATDLALPVLTAPVCAADPPNVLFLICDDLNCDIGCYGHGQVKTPNIDRLAARGVKFDRAYCQYPLCGPSRASFMTGLYPAQNLVTGNAIYIRERVPNVKTVSQMFRDAGYTSTRIGKIFHYNVPLHIGTSGHDDPESWDYTINPRGRDRNQHDKIFTLKPGQFGGTLSWLADEGDDTEQTDGIAATEATQVLHKYAADKTPFFLAVGMYRPHTPYVAPQKYFDMYPVDKIKIPQVPEGYFDTLPTPARNTLTRKKDQLNLDPALARQAIQAYYASITFADAQVGRVLDALRETGLDRNTIVVFTSDHGYHMGQHGYYQKLTLFEDATRVPLVMAGPGIAKGNSSKSMAEMIDFYPTLAELTGLTPPTAISGVSLADTLADPTKVSRASALTHLQNGYSLRTADFRYTEWGQEGAEGNELYDHRNDPAEMHNLAQDPNHIETVSALSKQLRARIVTATTPPIGIKQITPANRKLGKVTAKKSLKNPAKVDAR
ncbi:MAG: sulfatase [Rubripirellula sp.]